MLSMIEVFGKDFLDLNRPYQMLDFINWCVSSSPLLDWSIKNTLAILVLFHKQCDTCLSPFLPIFDLFIFPLKIFLEIAF